MRQASRPRMLRFAIPLAILLVLAIVIIQGIRDGSIGLKSPLARSVYAYTAISAITRGPDG